MYFKAPPNAAGELAGAMLPTRPMQLRRRLCLWDQERSAPEPEPCVFAQCAPWMHEAACGPQPRMHMSMRGRAWVAGYNYWHCGGMMIGTADLRRIRVHVHMCKGALS